MDYLDRKMKAKYIEERFPRYFIFGIHPTTRAVDVCDFNGTIVSCSHEEANRLIADRDALVDALIGAINHTPDPYELLNELKEKKKNL